MPYSFTLDKFKKIAPSVKNPEEWYAALTKHFADYEINTPERVAMFLAQCGHESGGFTILKENLNYSSDGLLKTFPKYYKTKADADAHARQPEKIANRVYASRMGNGDEKSGDGYRYCGRGIIQITGKDNYTQCSKTAWGDDSLLKDSSILTTVDGAVLSACWYWKLRNINKPSDAKDITTATKLINGGTNGLDDRTARYNNAVKILNS